MQVSVRTLRAEESVALIAEPAKNLYGIQSRGACAFSKALWRAGMVFRGEVLLCTVILTGVGVEEGSESIAFVVRSSN